MADITSDITIYEQETGLSAVANSPYEYKEIMVETPSTADDGDTFDVTLANYGITNVKTVEFPALSEGGTLGATLSSPPFITPDNSKILMAFYQNATQMAYANLPGRSTWHQWDL